MPVIEGGTGIQSATTYAPLTGGTTSTGAFQSASTGISNSGYVLTSTGASSLPTWQANSGGGTTGTFSVALTFGGSSTGITYSVNIGEYFAIGNLVCITVSVALTSKGSATGNAQITGLPFSEGGPLAGTFNLGSFYTSITFSGGYTVADAIVATNALSLYQMGSGVAITQLTDANFSSSSEFYISGIYFTS
ncbi:MAG: hypothetical protein WCF77_05065 [Minisyncoccia bacterium]